MSVIVAKLFESYFGAGYFFYRSEFGIMPKNEANHRGTNDFETIYFPIWGGLVWLGIVSMACAATIRDVWGCNESSPVIISDTYIMQIDHSDSRRESI